MTKTTPELKPCPFCGTVPELQHGPGNYGYTPPSVFVKCCNGLFVMADTEKYDWDKREHVNVKDEAIEAVVSRWNKRTL